MIAGKENIAEFYLIKNRTDEKIYFQKKKNTKFIKTFQ